MTQGPSRAESPRALLVGSAAIFVISYLFPIAAGVLDAYRLPKGVGILDVVLAVVLLGLSFLVAARQPGEPGPAVAATAVRTYRGLANAFLILLVLFFVAGDHVRWSMLLVGLAWRAWLLAWGLPSWLGLWQTQRPRQ